MSAVITSRTGVSALRPWAIARSTMSRSVIMPTSLSFSLTGRLPTSSCAIAAAASRIVCSGLARYTSRVITSFTVFMSYSAGCTRQGSPRWWSSLVVRSFALARARAFARGGRAACGSLRARSLFRRVRTARRAAPPSRRMCLSRQRRMRSGGMAFALQRNERCARTFARWRRPRRLARRARGTRLWRQINAGAARLRQSDRDRLLGRARAMFAFAHVLDFLAHEFAGLRRGRLSFALILARTGDGRLIGHDNSPHQYRGCNRYATKYVRRLRASHRA